MAPGGNKSKVSTSNNNSNNNNNNNNNANTAGSGSYSKAGGHSNPIATQTDDIKYRKKYKELKLKVNEVETDNSQLHVKILKSKKAIQRLRLERSILYDRLQSTTIPTNPFALKTVPHLSNLNSSASTSTSNNLPSNIQEIPTNYTLANPSAPTIYLEGLTSRKLSKLTEPGGKAGLEEGERPHLGIKFEGELEGERDLEQMAVVVETEVEKGGVGSSTNKVVNQLIPGEVLSGSTLQEGEAMQVDS